MASFSEAGGFNPYNNKKLIFESPVKMPLVNEKLSKLIC